ncbi:MAG: calcium/sodium antiporter [Planctomycetaceae bacterium]|nr:calcium/sodium antiporter [Planctomycetaceae bacterium]MBN8604543.1 calcium/sodium antiporter [Planctomycetota bacterium]
MVTYAIGLVILGLVLLVVGGEALLRGAVGMATLLKLTPAIIGLTVVAAGTSIPEMAVSVLAAMDNKADISVGNVVGSNIFNIAFIIGLCAIFMPIPIVGNTIKLEYPVLAIVTLLCLVVAQDGEVNRLDSILLISIYIAFTAYLVSLVRQQVSASEAAALTEEVKDISANEKKPAWWSSGLLVLVGVLLLAGGAQSTVSGAVELARLMGWSERIIGLTIVSIGTSLPEVVASAVSLYRGRADVSVGNVIGSNLFNILMILGISGFITPLPVQPAIMNSDCYWMLGITLLLFPIIFTGRRISQLEGFILLGCYGVYLTLLIRSA